MALANLCLILHAHLPYIRGPGPDAAFEERWFFEGVIQCYLPLLRVFEGLARDGVRARFTLSLSPTLIEMMDDPALCDRCARHLAELSNLAGRETARVRRDARLHRLAIAYRDAFADLAGDFDRRGRRLLPGFAAMRDAGLLDLITTAATHGHLPLLAAVPSATQRQIRVGAARFRSAFGFSSGGFWPPELAYRPGLESGFAEAGARWFCVDTRGLLRADVRPAYGTFAPVACPNGVAAFARDPELARRVWSAAEGYPGDPWYREYYRDIGFDLPPDALGRLAAPPGTRGPTGIKYHRVTGRTEAKLLYEPQRAADRAEEHAADFLRRVAQRCEAAASAMERPPLVTAPFDAELFGHWWHEGPHWLDTVARLAAGSGIVEMITPRDYLDRHPRLQLATPAESSWGEGGGHETWLNESTLWLWPRLHDAARRMDALASLPSAPAARGRRAACSRAAMIRANSAGAGDGQQERVRQQAARHLLLAQASDWPFMIRHGRAADVGERMVRDHLAHFDYLEAAARRGRVDGRRLAALEAQTPVFGNVAAEL